METWSYLGDALYARREDDNTVVLRANGTDENCPTVYLEPATLDSLLEWLGVEIVESSEA